MTTRIKIWALAAVASSVLFAGTASAQALKTAGACNDEYKAQKPALKSAKETKKEFVATCRTLPVGTPTPVGSVAAAPVAPAPRTAPAAPSAAPASVKTAGACNDEYKANKGALKDAKERKNDFIAACRALPPGTATPIGTAAVAPTPASASMQPAPVPQRTAPAPSPAPAAPVPPATTTRAQPAPGPSGANQYPAEASAKARCPGATVVWVNTQSRIYHFAGTKNYGNTKSGAYMCETDATAEGDRASLKEKHP